MEALNEIFPVILYGLLIILVVVLIILVVKLIKTISKVDLVVDDVNLKVKKLDGVFNIVDNKIIGCVEKGDYDLIIRIIDIQNFQYFFLTDSTLRRQIYCF